VGLVIVGILVMGIGAANAHYLFNFGTFVAVLGAVLFVAFVTLSTFRMNQQRAALAASRRILASSPGRGEAARQSS
jgi:hypothetical protein